MRFLTKLLFFGDSRRMSKARMFSGIIAWIVIFGVGISIVTQLTLFADDKSDFMKVAVVGPMSGDNEVIGQSMRQGVELYFDQFNAEGGIDGVKFAVQAFDDKDNPDAARQEVSKITRDSQVQAVIGHWSKDVLASVSNLYKNNTVALVTPSSTDGAAVAANEWYFSTLFSSNREARFLANYSRNVLGNKLTSIIFDRSGTGAAMAENYEKTYRRFGTAVRHKWSFDHLSDDVDKEIDEIVVKLKERKDAGVLFIAARETEAAKLVKKIRDARIRNLIIGPNSLAVESFRQSIQGQLKRNEEVAKYTNRILVSSPLLFDTANETAQNFRNSYIRKYGVAPDWVAAYAFDTANMVAEALKSALKGAEDENDDARSIRDGVRKFLASKNVIEDAISGITGETFFNDKGQAQKPVLMGVYDGADIISALTQLNPIKPGAGGNLIQELKRGRVLYVNDRFMYKTNVVYTGLDIKEISEINLEENNVVLDFQIWFRYRGKFEPQNLAFANAVEPIKLETPVEEKNVGDLIYRLYRVKGKFNLNFSDTFRQFGSHVVGLSFAHNNLNRNNLLYVVDVLGIGLDQETTMLDKVEKAQALSPNLGWKIDRAWISQDLSPQGTRGDPAYVGYGSADPDFSKIDLGVLIEPSEFNARDVIPSNWFIYMLIFGVLGIVAAIAMDRKEKGRFWAVQSWSLRVVAWPLFILAGSNLALDFAFQNFSIHITESIVLGFEVLWWMVPARLVGLAAERFVWQPLEDHTERTIPNVIRVFGSVVIYSFAAFAVVAFVFGQQLTSLLASTGLLAMIIGLAIQANISNIFSGIVINLERPFHVGDWIQIGDMNEGKVVDITWRTTRIRTRDGYVISVPNGQVSEAQIHNFNSFDSIRLELNILLDAVHSQDKVAPILAEAMENAENLLHKPAREVRFRGVEWEFGWIAKYELQFWIDDYEHKEDISEGVLETVYQELAKHGISPATPKLIDSGMTENPDGTPPGQSDAQLEELREAGE